MSNNMDHIIIDTGSNGCMPINMPAGTTALMSTAKAKWSQRTEPPTNVGGRSVEWAGGRMLDENLPSLLTDNDKGLCQYVLPNGSSANHPTSTYAMGDDPHFVTNTNSRVHGRQELRVAEASVMPNIVSVNTNAAIIMIAKKTTKLISKD